MIDSSWDIDKYKAEHECDEHWELRKKFILAHKDRLPEDELVCMAQVFTNIEFLGCRYPDETMIRVAELAKGVVEEFREKKKNTLKRTFVAASDAASSKVKGLGRTTVNKEGEGDMTQTKRAKPMAFVADTKSNSPPPEAQPREESEPVPEIETRWPAAPRQLRPPNGPFGNVVVIITPDFTPFQILDRALQMNKLHGAAKYEARLLDNGLVETTLTLKGEPLSTAVGVDKRTARDLAATTALEKIREQCYSIVVKKECTGQSVEQADLGVGPAPRPVGVGPAPCPDQKLGDDNMGSKLMRLMGWSGGGLGSAAQGRVEPVTATATVRRAGLGMDGSGPGPALTFRQAVRKYLLQWLSAGATPDLIFSTDFDKKHRKITHEVAKSLRLKSQSYGSGGDRRLVVSKKVKLWDLVEELAQTGGHSEKYELLDPGTPLPLSKASTT